MSKTMMALWAIGALTDKEVATGKLDGDDKKCTALLNILVKNSNAKEGARYQNSTMKDLLIVEACKKISPESCKELNKYLLSNENCKNMWEIIKVKKEVASK